MVLVFVFFLLLLFMYEGERILFFCLLFVNMNESLWDSEGGTVHCREIHSFPIRLEKIQHALEKNGETESGREKESEKD